MAYVSDRDQGFGFAPVAAAAVAQAAPTVIKAIGGLAKPKTIAAVAAPEGYTKLAQDGGSFTLSATTEVLVLAPNGTSATQTLPAGTYPCSGFLGRDLQKGASKICAKRNSTAASISSFLSSVGVTSITGAPPTTTQAVATTEAPADPFATMLAAIAGYGNTGLVGAQTALPSTSLPATSMSMPAATPIASQSAFGGISPLVLIGGGILALALLRKR